MVIFVRNVVVLLLATSASVLASPASVKRSVSFQWGKEKVRGVNLGGWLVLEPWITPSIFQNVDQSLGIRDEWTLTEKLGTEAAFKILEPHWDTWVGLEDFQKIAAAGFNTVRIPVGYWSYQLYGGDSYTPGAAPYVDKAIEWARETGIQVWIDLHGAPGSQNGYDNSGQLLKGGVLDENGNVTPGGPQWQQNDTVAHTLAVMKKITDKYAKTEYQDVVAAIELLNEPATYFPNINGSILVDYYQDAYDTARKVSDTPIMLQDGFIPIGVTDTETNWWNGKPVNGSNVVMDHHEYQVFSNAFVNMTYQEHLDLVCNNSASYTGGNRDKWLIIGEWSGAMTDCAPYLNGYFQGSRYDQTFKDLNNATAETIFVGSCQGKSGNISTWSSTYKKQVKTYIATQIQVFEAQADGWTFWNFKTEGNGASEWDALALVDAGLFPTLKNRTAVTGGQICK